VGLRVYLRLICFASWAARLLPRPDSALYLLATETALTESAHPESPEVTSPQTQFQGFRAFGGQLLIFAFLLLTLFISAILLTPPSHATQEPSPADHTKRRRADFVAGEALVRFKPGRAFEGQRWLTRSRQEPSAAPADTEQLPVQVDRFAGSDLVEGLRLAHTLPEETLQAIAALRARDDVLYAEPNFLRHVDLTPNDPSFSQLYGMNLIGAPQTWDLTQGSRNIVVGVIDEGIDRTHQDLQANIWTNPSPGSIPGITGDVNGYDFRDDTGNIIAEPHATHVAGTIGAAGNNGVGVTGVNWQVSLMSLRFISDAAGSGTTADAIKAYNYVRQMRDLWSSSNHTKGADIRAVNASYGGGGYSQAEADAISAMGQSGVLFVAAAGNDAPDTDIHPNYPSDYSLPNVISVAATTSSDTVASFSNFGRHTVLIGAPGSGIFSTLPNNNYGFLSGTSMATPHVAGSAALLCAANSNLSVNQLRALLAFNGDAISALQGRSLTGRRLNVFKSLQAMNENDTTPPGTVTNLQVAAQNGRSARISWTASGDDGAAGQASLYDVSFVDGATSAVVPLTSAAPVGSGSSQSVSVNIPYRHTAGTIRLREFDNVGNEGTPATTSLSVPANFADPYLTALNPPAALSTGGTPLGLTFDDRYLENYALPFSFSFFGQLYNSVTISTNGNLYFSPPPKRPNGDADDVPSSTADLSLNRMISGMWDDLDLSRGNGADVYVVQPDSTRIIFRWQGVRFDDGSPINFEIELRSDGSIVTRYGAGNTNVLPVVGISGGEPDPYVITQLTSELSPITLTNAQSASFTPRTVVQLSSANYTVNEGDGHANITLTRSGDVSGAASVSLATSDTAGSQNCSTANGKASARCDYVAIFGTAQFGAGESSKTVTIPIIDDALNEGTETFTISISNGFGTSLGAQTVATVTIIDNDSVNGPNPLADNSFFVRQHYLDFLNREPDPPGITFWTGQMTNCGASDLTVCRVNVSGAFFLSIEFQQTGYLVERVYKTAFGDANGVSTLGGTSHNLRVPFVRLNQFLPDTQRIGQGVVVGQGNWQQQLDDNKNAFAEDFVQRPAFLSAFPLSMSSATFVDTLNTRARDNNDVPPLSQSDRDALVAALTNGTMTRGQVVRTVAENANLANSEKNRAFVLMQYFGYLRRNPNDPQDTDYTGYEFWLNKLNQFNGDYVGAEMVKAFLSSSEYNQRFSQ
jgi:subtilisin family serine protease